MTIEVLQLEPARAARYRARLAAALSASRANASFPDARLAASHLRAASGTLDVVVATGLPSYESWARLAADWQVASDGAGGPRHDALRGIAKPRLGDLEVALRSADQRARRVHVTLDKVATDGRLLRLLADLTVERRLRDQALFELLFPAADLPIELLLVRVRAARGVQAVERVGIGAVDLFADVEVTTGPAIDPPRLALAVQRGVALSLASSLIAADVTPGDNDLLSSAVDGDAAAVRARLGTAALPQRLYLDRKLVVNAAARPVIEARVRARGTRTVLYTAEAT